MLVQVAAAKVAKYATAESGDTLELIERPHGGISAVLVDGQRSGRAAKLVSNLAVRKAVSLLGEGVRDGAVARAAHDYLRTHRQGQVSAELQILSVDLVSRTLVISRNTRCAAYLVRDGELEMLDEPSEPIGIRIDTKPVIREVPLAPSTVVVACTDGLCSAGDLAGHSLNLPALILEVIASGASAQAMADQLLAAAIAADQGRPRDDTSVLVVSLLAGDGEGGVRRLSASFPVR